MQRRTVQGNAGIPLSALQAVFDIAGIGLFAWSGEWFTAGGVGIILLARWIIIWFIRPQAEHADTSCLEQPGPRLGEAVPVKDGACIPADGRILQGVILVDESIITGETRLQERRAGDIVFGGSRCRAGSAVIRVMRSGADSVLGKNETLLSHAGFGTKAEQWIRACGYTAFIVGAITSLAVGINSLSFILAGSLLIASGGADLATRIAPWVRSTLRKMQKHGLVLQDAQALEELAEIRGIVLHKSELVPLESYQLASLDRTPNVTENLIWECIALAQKHAEQAIERLLYREAIRRVGSAGDPEKFHIYPGRGVWVRTESREILVGNTSLFAERGVNIPPGWHSSAKDTDTGSPIIERYVSINGSCIGRLRIAVKQFEHGKKNAEELAQIGIREQILLSPDSVEKTGRQAEALGITQALPTARLDDVLRELEQLMKKMPVLMIGDGVSDTQAVMRADLSLIPDPTGTAAMRDNHPTVLLSDRLDQLPAIFRLAQIWINGFRTASILWLLTLLVLLCLAGTGILNPLWIAIGRLIQAISIDQILARKRLP